MKKYCSKFLKIGILCFTLFQILPAISVGQTNSNKTSKSGIYLADGSKLDEYKKTFEIKNFANPDKKLISEIDVSKYWGLAKKTERTEVYDSTLNVTLILYSQEETKDFLNAGDFLIIMPTGYTRDTIKTTP